MKAAVYDHNGPPEVLRYTDVPDPKIRSRDVLIQVEAISVEGGDLINRRSSPPGHPAYVVGYAAAGTVVAIGDAVTDRKPGDRVTSWGLDGSHAQLRAVPTDQTWLLPAGAASSQSSTGSALNAMKNASYPGGYLRAMWPRGLAQPPQKA